ncbi:MAG TPA: amidohydrolase family protein [Planctomycetota bacterium]
MRPSAATVLIPFLLALAGPLLRAQQAADLVIRNAKVLSEDGNSWRTGSYLLLKDGRIAALSEGVLGIEDITVFLDAKGLYVVPGLIDLHTHFTLHPYDETPWNDQVLEESIELRTIRAVTAARATLEAGFTTVRELGTEGAGYADVALRDAIAQGIVPGPRILASTLAIVATASYGPMGFDPRIAIQKGAQEVTGADAMRAAVRAQIHAGADWIKVYADYRRAPGAKATATLTLEELQAAVDEAKSAGIRVAAHATTGEGIRRAAKAKVRTIEHGGASGSLGMLALTNTVLCPTLAASEAMAIYAGWRPGEPEPERIVATRKAFADALKAGVTIACGSDAGVFDHGDNVREIELMHEFGMTPVQALRAATATAARVLDRDDLGRIGLGAVADLVLVAEDPLQDPAALRKPLLVIQGGRIVVDRRER